jgi:hypothetical protein
MNQKEKEALIAEAINSAPARKKLAQTMTDMIRKSRFKSSCNNPNHEKFTQPRANCLDPECVVQEILDE